MSARFQRCRRQVAVGVSTVLLAGTLVLTFGPASAASASTLYTSAVAGSSVAGTGDGGPALGESMSGLNGVALDGSGDVFLTDGNRVRMVAAASGTFYGQAMTAGDIYTIAGGGSVTGDGGLAISANISYANGVAVDSSGDVFIAEQSQNKIREVSPSDIITTVAGNGTSGFSGDGGPATSAKLNSLNHNGWGSASLDAAALVPGVAEVRYLKVANDAADEARGLTNFGRYTPKGALAQRSELLNTSRIYANAAGRLDWISRLADTALATNAIFHIVIDGGWEAFAASSCS
jgi:hypothetical protein